MQHALLFAQLMCLFFLKGTVCAQVRHAMAFIPQTPVLFTGTVRFNLDPWGASSDAELWAALRRAHLAPVVVSNPLVR